VGGRFKPDIGRESRFLTTPPAVDAFVSGGGGSQYITMTFGTVKLEWCGYPTVKKIEETVFHLRCIATVAVSLAVST